MSNITSQIAELGLVPVIVINDVSQALPLAKALIAAGLPCAEITYRTECAGEAIKVMSQFPELLLGAGTVITKEQAKEAMENGARYIISPGFAPEVSKFCCENDLPYYPGVATPADIQNALDDGWKTLKFFPAEANGGVKTLKAISAPYPGITFVPTGGINANNVGDYRALPQVVACGGSWMVPSSLMNEGKYDEITALCKEALELLK